MDRHIGQRMRLFALLLLAGAAAGLAYMPFIQEGDLLRWAPNFAAQGILIVGLTFGFELFVAEGKVREVLRRWPFGAVFAAKALVTTGLILIAYLLGGVFLFDRFDVETPLLDLARDTGYALGIGVVLQFLLMVRGIVGGRVLVNLLLGRYHRPLEEERVFMFLDVSGSTALAERLGGAGAYEMISRFFFDVAQVTRRYGGETHEYIGDEVVVTWPLSAGTEDARCLRCFFAIQDRIAAKAESYRRDFGAVPGFRAGLHGGPIVAGECGDDKREIVYFGDTINTAARIQEACKQFNRDLLVSGDLLDRMDLGVDLEAVSLGRTELRGRARPVELFAVERVNALGARR